MKKWNELSMSERVPYIKMALDSGITDLGLVSDRYNSYAKGGYLEWKRAIKAYKGIDIDNDPTYDYEGYYTSNPKSAWAMLDNDPEAHFTDEFKTALHPSFSDESRYSGTKNKYNPKGIRGGRWIDDTHYIMSHDMLNNNDYDVSRTREYLKRAESRPVTIYAPDGSVMLDEVVVTPRLSALNRSNKFAEGGDTQEDDNSTVALDTAKEIGVSMIPIYGTYLEGKKFIEDPSWENAAWLGLSLVSEVPFLKYAKLGKAAKIAKTAKKAPVLVKDISKGITKQANKDLMYHLDYGNKAGSFTKNGAYVKKGTLYPGKAVKEGQRSYTWFNEGKPYATSIKEKPLKRAIIKDKKDIPDLIRVRESTEPIGQWSGNSGLVLKSEMVTPSPVPLNNAFIYKRKQLPLVGEFWLRTN